MTIDIQSRYRKTVRIGLLGTLVVLSLGMGRRPSEKTGAKAGGKPATLMAPEELFAGISTLEKHADSENASPAQRKKIERAIEVLRTDMQASTPLLVHCFTKADNKRASRMACGEVLAGDVRYVSTSEQETIISVLRDENGHPLVRMWAARLLMLRGGDIPQQLHQEIKSLALRLSREGQYQDVIRKMVVRHYMADDDVQTELIAEMFQDKSLARNAKLHVLGKMKCQILVDLIAKELDSANPEENFTKTRMYLALGDVGGPRAFELLRTHYDKEASAEQKRRILKAMGATKDPRAREILLQNLVDGDRYIVALFGLKFLGDATVIPALEHELGRNLPDYERSMVQKTIDAIRKGDDRTHW